MLNEKYSEFFLEILIWSFDANKTNFQHQP